MAKSNKAQKKQPQHFALRTIKPLTDNQSLTFREFDMGRHLMLHGVAGTGKTFCALYLALEEILKNNSIYDQIIIVRSVVPTRDMGFLPGSAKEKAKIYEEPYHQICDDLFGRGDGYDVLKNKNLVNFTTTSHLRGMTFRNAIVIVDEVQNMTGDECSTVITRTGENCRLIYCGDFRQSDLKRNERNGFFNFMDIIRDMPSFAFVEFGLEDIVRSGLVKEFLTIKERKNITFL